MRNAAGFSAGVRGPAARGSLRRALQGSLRHRLGQDGLHHDWQRAAPLQPPLPAADARRYQRGRHKQIAAVLSHDGVRKRGSVAQHRPGRQPAHHHRRRTSGTQRYRQRRKQVHGGGQETLRGHSLRCFRRDHPNNLDGQDGHRDLGGDFLLEKNFCNANALYIRQFVQHYIDKRPTADK